MGRHHRARHQLQVTGPRRRAVASTAVRLEDLGDDGLGRAVRHVTVTPEQAREAFLGMGATPDVAAKYVEMYQAFDNGTLKVAEPRTPETTTPTTLAEFARQVIKPLVS
jgi:hypothetical protein